MNFTERKGQLISIENATCRAEEASSIDRAREVFAMFGAKSLDDLPENSFDQVFSGLTRLSAD